MPRMRLSCLHDATNGEIIDANLAALDLFGVTPEEIVNTVPGKNGRL